MLKSRAIDRVCAVALVVMLALTAVIWTGKASAGRQTTIEIGYEGLFDQSAVHTIDIEIDDWDGFIASATQEEYVECSVTIDGEKLSGVGIRAKGNTSLSSVASLDSEKYSFKIEFDHFVEGRLYNGLDKLSLNNLIYDATMMKDYLAYTLMARMDVPSPLCAYAQITVNGEPWGLYLAVEGVEDGFMERNNMTTGELYKPDSMGFGGGRGNGRDFDIEEFRVKDEETEAGESETAETVETVETDTDAATDAETQSAGPGGFPSINGEGFGGGFPGMPSGDFTPPDGMEMPEGFEMPGGGPGDGFDFGMGSSDVKLAYVDDDPDSYSNIFDNAKTKVGKKDKARLIESLRKLSAGEDMEDTVFTDEVINYLAVHDFLQNGDSYTGTMVHNYYLYEEDGQLAIIPWDYNLAFGGFGASDGTSLVNSPIDSPVDNGNTSDRPLIAWIFEDEEALERYHQAYERFVTETIDSGWLEAEIDRVAELIRPYVAADENAFYTAEEFDQAVETLKSYCALRGESIRGQLDGTIPSTTDGQRADSAALVDASDLDATTMGSMNNGAGGAGPQMPGGASGGMPDMSSMGGFTPPSGDMPDMSSMGGFTPPAGMSDGAAESGDTDAATEAAEDAAQTTEDAVQTTEDAVQTAEDAGQAVGDAAQTTEDAGQAGQPAGGPQGMQGFPGGFPGDMGFPGSQSADTRGQWIQFGIWSAVLLLGILVAARFRGHNT